MSRRIVRASFATLVGLTLAVTACSKGSDDTTPSPTGAPSTSSVSGSASPSAGGTFIGNGVSFDYPKDWQEFTLSGTTAQSGTSLWNETVGLDPVNFASVAGYTINISITKDNISRQEDGLTQQMQRLFQQAGGTLSSVNPTEETMGGFPALGFAGTARNPSGATVSSRLVLAFNGTTEYFVNCQYDDTGKAAILAGCDQIVSTFSLG